MSNEAVFLLSLVITLVLTLGVTVYLHRPLKRLLLHACDSPERVSFWVAGADVILVLTPLWTLMMNRQAVYSTHPMVLADLLWAPLLGMVIAVVMLLMIVALVANLEPTWEARIIPKSQRDDLKRLLSRVDAVRAREILVHEMEEAEQERPAARPVSVETPA